MSNVTCMWLEHEGLLVSSRILDADPTGTYNLKVRVGSGSHAFEVSEDNMGCIASSGSHDASSWKTTTGEAKLRSQPSQRACWARAHREAERRPDRGHRKPPDDY